MCQDERIFAVFSATKQSSKGLFEGFRNRPSWRVFPCTFKSLSNIKREAVSPNYKSQLHTIKLPRLNTDPWSTPTHLSWGLYCSLLLFLFWSMWTCTVYYFLFQRIALLWSWVCAIFVFHGRICYFCGRFNQLWFWQETTQQPVHWVELLGFSW